MLILLLSFLYDATDEADNLYIITSYDNWNLDKAILMKKNADGSFIASCDYPLGTKLEFKICRSKAWTDVEKGYLEGRNSKS
ncbi:MAG: hypothetical protein L6U99_00380 [Clostridium sp.]|nr:MAG: hypothetical protein L6U99_00380 [Clostridium sp.]